MHRWCPSLTASCISQSSLDVRWTPSRLFSEVIEVPVRIDPQLATPGTLLHNLGVRQRIEELEGRQTIRESSKEEKEELLDLSMAFHQVCTLTSFVIVDQSERSGLTGWSLDMLLCRAFIRIPPSACAQSHSV
eukprot:EC693034.1.p1 GENE.EC693034.1~~EC693034.1.p1  ORF type:complete len:133 (+),score=14.07 EC693034.1:286-684(+)